MSNSKEIGRRLRQFAVDRFGTVAHLERELKLAKNALSQYVTGRNTPGPLLQEKLRHVGCDIEWIATGKKPHQEKHIIPGAIPLMQIPVYAHVHAGQKNWVLIDNPTDFIGIPVSHDKTQIGLVVKGKSMSPEINNGDVVIVSEKAHVKSGDLCIVEWDDNERHLRRISYQKDMVVLSSNNSVEYPPIIAPKTKIHRILRVMQHVKKY